MKRAAHLVLIAEIVAICLLHAMRINHSSKSDDRRVEKERFMQIRDKIEYASFRQLAIVMPSLRD